MNEGILTDSKMQKIKSVTSVEAGSLQSNYNYYIIIHTFILVVALIKYNQINHLKEMLFMQKYYLI